jgi:hypothetical protein
MDLNIVNIFYLFFRLAPFIIVSYFTLQSIFNQDLKGLIYLFGLIVAAVLTVLIGNVIPFPNTPILSIDKYSKAKCNSLTLGSDAPISRLPLSQTVFGYTLAYLSYFIGVNNLTTQNIPTFVIFPILILADMFWNVSNDCSSNELLLAALIIGGAVGAVWALIIDSTKMANLSYFSGISNKDVCSKPSKQMIRCKQINKTPKEGQ